MDDFKHKKAEESKKKEIFEDKKDKYLLESSRLPQDSSTKINDHVKSLLAKKIVSFSS